MAVLNTNFTNLTTYPNSFKRQEPTPLEAYSLFTSKTDAENYAKTNPVAYVGQIVVVIDATNKVCTPYVISDTTGTLGEISGTVDLDDYVTGPSSATGNAIALYDGTTGKKIKNSGATIDANRNLKFSGPGDILWEDGSYHQRIHITDDSTQNTAVFTFQQTEDTAKTWNDLFTIQDRGTIIAKNSTGGALSLTLDRGNNANWRWLSDNGNFIAQCDYTSAKVNYFNVLTMAYNTGNVSVDKGTLTSKGGFIHGNLTAASGKTKDDYVLLAGGSTKPLSEFGIGTGGTIDLSGYLPLTGSSTDSTTNNMTGPITFWHPSDRATGKTYENILINSYNKDVNIWHVYGNSGQWASQYGFNLLYKGEGSGNDNYLSLYAHNQSNSTHFEVYRTLQDGTTTWKRAINFTGGISENGTALSSKYATQEWVEENYLTINTFNTAISGTDKKTLAYFSTSQKIEDIANTSTDGSGNIKAMSYGIYTDVTNDKAATWQYNSSTDCVELVW